ncbi:hypothetical protein B4U80_06078 [Leptotrombidium deliense]|uniref:Uncharacterized protein n=1 Tax=Leptotrombidium deliense TaxID=299467 RepID=A0A443SDG3_9ACAR|nr:hypothetical protein B4U80_06078 [Leptotrombidium deliense]
MWKAFGTDSSEPTEAKSHLGYFRPRISSISGVLHNITKQRFLTPPTTAVKEDIESHASHSANPAAYDYGFDTSRINGACLTGNIAPSPSRSSYGDVLAYSRSPSARASIDSTIAHGVYNLDNEGQNVY